PGGVDPRTPWPRPAARLGRAPMTRDAGPAGAGPRSDRSRASGPRPRPPFGVSAWIYGDAPLASTLERIAAAGYDAVELPGEPAQWRPSELRRLLDQTGLRAVALTASCMFPATPRDLANPDPTIRARAVGYLVE